MFRHGLHLSASVMCAVALTACGTQPPAEPQQPVPQQVAAPTPPPATPVPPGKVASGTIRELQTGDVACYITLETSAGELANEMADFEICEKRDLIGKKVALTWKEANVLAAECQGDVDCGKSDKVWLIEAVKIQ